MFGIAVLRDGLEEKRVYQSPEVFPLRAAIGPGQKGKLKTQSHAHPFSDLWRTLSSPTVLLVQPAPPELICTSPFFSFDTCD